MSESKPLSYKQIGSGTYGSVYRIDANTVRKDCSIICNDLINIETATIREIVFLSTFSHPHIRGANLIEFNDLKVSIHMPEGGTPLDEWVKITSLAQRLPIIPRIVAQVCSVLSYLAKMNMCHGDLKPQNILINSNNDIKVIDWGAFSFFPQKQWTNGCTEQFAAPELLEKPAKNGPPADIFSLGMIIRFLVYGTIETMRWIKWNCHTHGKIDILNQRDWSNSRTDLNFIRKCQSFLEADPKSRSTAAEICGWKELANYKVKDPPIYNHSNGKMQKVIWTDNGLFSTSRRTEIIELICDTANRFKGKELIMPSIQLFEEYVLGEGSKSITESNIKLYAGACLMIASCLLDTSLMLNDFLRLIDPTASCISFYQIFIDILQHFSCEVYRIAFTDQLEHISMKHLKSLLSDPDIMMMDHSQRSEHYARSIARE
jgi:serine/threonine protein kinase